MGIIERWRRRGRGEELAQKPGSSELREGLLVPQDAEAYKEAVETARQRAAEVAREHPEFGERAAALAELGIAVPEGCVPVGVIELNKAFEVIRDARAAGPYGMDKIEFVLQVPRGKAVALEEGKGVDGSYGPTSAVQMNNITVYQDLFRPSDIERVAFELNYFAVPSDLPIEQLGPDALRFIGAVRYNAGQEVIGRVKRAGIYRDDKTYAHDRARASKNI